jgi:hypothetical protein
MNGPRIVEAEVKCVSCGRIWWVGPGLKEQPECPACYSIGVPTGRARSEIQKAARKRKGARP